MGHRSTRLSVVIPSFNGGAILAEHLPGVVAQAAALRGGADVLVVDDGSSFEGDRTVEVVAAAGPPARLVRLPRNRGFAPTCNAGAREARGALLLFLNNDMSPEAGCLEALAALVESRPDLFAASPVIVNREESFPESSTRLRFRRGVFDVVFPGRDGVAPPARGELRRIAYACGGALACRREAFLRLGGFPELHAPFYWEDADLGWRARRAGYEIVETGDARALHDHARTIRARFSSRQRRRTYERNRLLFTWVHLEGGAWLRHIAWLGLRWIAAALRGRPAAAAFPAALLRAPQVVAERRRLRATDRPGGRSLPTAAEIRSRAKAGWP